MCVGGGGVGGEVGGRGGQCVCVCAALCKGQFLLSTASWHVGCYVEATFKASQPASQYTGGWEQ